MPPKVIRPFLWFNDLKKIDLQRDRVRIILNVLNFGTKAATDWLFDFYPLAEIKKVIRSRNASAELSAKSLNYWTLILNINSRPLTKSRF